MPNFGRPRKIVADTRRGSATRGRASACAGCAACDECAACADRRPAGQHARPCVRRAATLKVPACRTYDPMPARVRKSTLRADCNADGIAPSTGTGRKSISTDRIGRTTGIDGRRSEHRKRQGRGGWGVEAADASGRRPEDVSGQLGHRQKVQRVVMEDRLDRAQASAQANCVVRRPVAAGPVVSYYRAGDSSPHPPRRGGETWRAAMLPTGSPRTTTRGWFRKGPPAPRP